MDRGGVSALGCAYFVGACGIAVRAIAPFVQDKFHDPAVLCVDEAGTFVIPLLSGHVGGANRLAEFVAGGIGAVPVVTTATDVERKFAVDVFAKDHGLVITDRVLAKRISADILAEEPVGVFSDFGFSGWKKIPEGLFRNRLCKRNIWITVSDREKDGIPSRPCPAPCTEVCGTGDRMQTGNSRGEDPRDGGGRYEAERDRSQKCLCGREYRYQKAGTGDHRFCKYAAGPVSHFSSEELNSQPGTFTESEFVKKTTGTGNVCERSAVAACRMGVRDCRILFKKEAGDGVTVAAAYDPGL